jgi:hypothetical protein
MLAHQPLEVRVALEGGEGGVDLKPAGREVVGHLEERRQPVECLVIFPNEQVDAHELGRLPRPSAYQGWTADGSS